MMWVVDRTEHRLHVIHAGPAGTTAGDATPADIVAALEANVDAAAEVWRALTKSQGIKDELTARAEQAERERDDLRILVQHYEDDWKALGQTVAAACGCDIDDISYVPTAAQNSLKRLRKEQDEARTELERAKQLLAEGHRHVLGAWAHCGTVQEERDALRTKLARYEAVIHWVRCVEADDVLQCLHPSRDDATCQCGPCMVRTALRSLDDSGGPGAASACGAASPEPAGSSRKGESHLYECETCSAKPGAPFLCGRCHRARAVAGDLWRGPLPRATQNAQGEPAGDCVTRAELLAALRRAATRVAGPARAALITLGLELDFNPEGEKSDVRDSL